MTDTWPRNTQHPLVQTQSSIEGESIQIDWSIAVSRMVSCRAADPLQKHQIREELQKVMVKLS